MGRLKAGIVYKIRKYRGLSPSGLCGKKNGIEGRAQGQQLEMSTAALPGYGQGFFAVAALDSAAGGGIRLGFSRRLCRRERRSML